MEPLTIFLYVLSILLIILSIIFLQQSNSEGFTILECPNCGQRDQWQCYECSTCGWCITPEGFGECVPGDQYGPYFRKDCLYWDYGPNYLWYRPAPRWYWWRPWSWWPWRPRWSRRHPYRHFIRRHRKPKSHSHSHKVK